MQVDAQTVIDELGNQVKELSLQLALERAKNRALEAAQPTE